MTQRVSKGFSFDDAGTPRTLQRGRLFADDHPWVKRFPGQFELADDAATQSPVRAVETATAAPGSARTISRSQRRQSAVPDGE